MAHGQTMTDVVEKNLIRVFSGNQIDTLIHVDQRRPVRKQLLLLVWSQFNRKRPGSHGNGGKSGKGS